MRIDAPIITGSFSLNGSTLGSLASVATTGSNTFLGGQSATSFAGDQLTANDRAYLRRIDGIAGTTIEVIAPISASAGITGSTNFDTIVNKPTLVSGSSQVIDIISSLNTATASFTPRISNLESKSSSVDISISNINNFTASNGNESLNSKTGSYATTGSNTFFGTQTYSGSVYIANDLIVQGSSSIQYISASSVSIGTNIVQLNTANPSVRFAGLTIIDSGSIGGSGSFLYDSVHDEFVFVHRGNGTNITSSHFVLGPETYDSLGNELYLTCNKIPKGTGKEHLIDSGIWEIGGNVGIGSSSPCAKLHINATSAGDDLLYFCDGSTVTKFVYNVKTGVDDALILRRNHTTQGNLCIMSWTYCGNVGIGVGAPSNVLDIAKASQDSMVILTESSDNGDCTSLFYARRSRGTSLTSPTAIQSANNLGGLAIGGHDGSSYKMGAKIFGSAAENWSAGCNGTDIVFSTNSAAKCLPTEKVRINASGLVNFACNICVNNNVIIYNGSNSFYAWTNCSSFQPGLYGQICIGSSMTGVYTKMYGSGVDAGLFGINTQCMAFVGTDGACGKGMLIGTANNAPIYIGTNNVEAFRVTTNQYLLLGSTQNSYKLEVTAPTNTNASYFRAGGTSGYAAIAFSGDGGQAIGVLSTVSNDIIYLGTANGTIGNQFGTNGEFAIQKGSNTNILKLMCTGVACFAGAICVNEAVYVRGSFPGVKLDRAATSAQSDVNWKNAGTSVWSIGTAVKAVGSCLDFYSYSISDNVMRFTPAGIVTKPYQPSFLAYGMGNTTLNSYVIYPSVHLNKGSHYNASTGVFTAPVAGVYYFSWSAIGATAGSVYRWFLRINDTNFLGDYHLRQDTNETGDAYATNGNRDVIINLAANDTVRIYFVSDASTLPYGVNGTTDSYLNFMGYLLG
jgi:hypothetical protein